MKKNRDNVSTDKSNVPGSHCDKIIVFILSAIIIAVPLFFDTRLFSVFDLSKITILYILNFAIIAIWSVKVMVACLISGRREGSGHTAPGRYHISDYICNPLISSHPLNLPIITLVIISGLSTFFSISRHISFFGAYKRYDGFLSILVYTIIFYTITNFVKRKSLDLFFDLIIWTACGASVYGILQNFGIDMYRWQIGFSLGAELGGRAASTFGHPAFFSAFLIMAMPLVMVKIFSSKQGYKASLYIAILALLTIAFYYTRTRATFLGLIISTIFFFSLTGRKFLSANKIRTAVILSLLTGISLYYNINDKASPVARFSGDFKKIPSQHSGITTEDADFTAHLDGTISMRVFQYLTGFKIIYDYPILGIGPDTLGMIFPGYLAKVYEEKDEFRGFENQDRIHNDFLDMMVSRGVLGLGAYAWFIFAYSRMVWKGCRKADGMEKVVIIGLCSGCLGYFIQNQFSFGHIPIITLFWFLTGMSVVACSDKGRLTNDRLSPICMNRQAKTRKTWHMYKRIIKSTACIIIICLMAAFTIKSLYRYKADIYFSQGQKLLFKNSTVEAVGNYEMAVRHNPEELRYRNALNDLYMKMASILFNKGSESIDGGLPESSMQGQATVLLLLTNAIAGAEEVQSHYPDDYRSLFTLGQAYHLLDQISEEDYAETAIKYYKHAARLQPFKSEIRDKLSQLYVEKGYHE